MKELEVILKELSPAGTNALKNVGLAINEMGDGTTSATLIKSTPRSDSVLRNLLNSPEELDIYYPDGQDERQAKSSNEFLSKFKVKVKKHLYSSFLLTIFFFIEPSSAVESMLKTKTIAQYLDKILLEVQNHITYIRNVFEKLCRWG